MAKLKEFRSFEDFEAWANGFEDYSECETIPVLIDDGWKAATNMYIECKSWRTALRRFRKVFGSVAALDGWLEGIQESAEAGCFQDLDGWRCSFSYDEEENRRLNTEAAARTGRYSWGIEEIDDGLWYIYVNVSGMYAGRPERT